MSDKDNNRHSAIRTRLQLALNQNLYTDLYFILGGSAESEEKIVVSSHKLIVRLSSPFLDELITKHESEAGPDAKSLMIKLDPNICPILFKRLLKFIYTDEIDSERIADFLKLANQFGFYHLSKQLLEAAKSTELNQDNVVYMLQIGNYCLDLELTENCLEYINRNAKAIFQHKSLLEMSESDLDLLLSSDDLNVNDDDENGEFLLFRGIISWAHHQCKMAKLDPSNSSNIRRILINLRMKIRYNLIPYDKLHSDVKKIFNLLEFIKILKTFLDPNENSLGICTRKRNMTMTAETETTESRYSYSSISSDESDIIEIITPKTNSSKDDTDRKNVKDESKNRNIKLCNLIFDRNVKTSTRQQNTKNTSSKSVSSQNQTKTKPNLKHPMKAEARRTKQNDQKRQQQRIKSRAENLVRTSLALKGPLKEPNQGKTKRDNMEELRKKLGLLVKIQ